MKCEQCNGKIYPKDSKQKVIFCPFCGSINHIGGEGYPLDETLNLVQEHFDKKQYDEAMVLLYNLKEDYKTEQIYLLILKCFHQYRIDSSAVLNNYLFSSKNEKEIYNELKKIDLSKEGQAEVNSYYEEFKALDIEELKAEIQGVKDSINQLKIEIEKNNSYPNRKKFKYYNQTLIICIVVLIISAIMSFAFDEQIVKIIGLIFMALTIAGIVTIAALTPTRDKEVIGRNLDEHLKEQKETLTELQKELDKYDLEEKNS